MEYQCVYIGNADNIVWDAVEAIKLVDTVTSDEPHLSTSVRAVWTDREIRIRFECEDDHIVATMTRRDDPIYEEDVVEVFIDETGEGSPYLEFEVSPNNVVFDAVVTLDADGKVHADTSWDAVGLTTVAGELVPGVRYAEFRIPFENFRQPPVNGTVWRWNCYRIDDDKQGRRHYSAWSPTGKANFHVPEKFGALRYVEG